MTREFKGLPFKTSNKIRILHVLSDKEKRVRPLENLVKGLDKSMFLQIVCYLKGQDEDLTELETHGHDVITLDASAKKLRRFQLGAVLQLSKFMKERRIDIVHCQRHKPIVYGTLAAYMADKNIKVIGHVRGLNRTRTLRRKLLNRVLFRRISRIIAVSDAVRDDVISNNVKSLAAKVVTIYNGIDVKQFVDPDLGREAARARLNFPDKKVFVYGTVGRLAETKGQAILLQAFARVSQECPQSWLVLAGAGRLESELRGLAAELNIQKYVRFLGHRPDIPQVLKAYDVFVLPSVAEGLPGALLEAMATGLPVIASRVGGVSEILHTPGLGLMVAPQCVDELASAMKGLYKTTEEKRNEIGKALRERVAKEFSKEKMISAITAEYLTVMKIPPAS